MLEMDVLSRAIMTGLTKAVLRQVTRNVVSPDDTLLERMWTEYTYAFDGDVFYLVRRNSWQQQLEQQQLEQQKALE